MDIGLAGYREYARPAVVTRALRTVVMFTGRDGVVGGGHVTSVVRRRWLAARQSAVSASESADGRIDQRAAAPTAAERGRPEFIYRRGQWSAQQRPAARSVRPRRLRR